jgi:uncharacterized repeat protein (TIGR03803 family)
MLRIISSPKQLLGKRVIAEPLESRTLLTVALNTVTTFDYNNGDLPQAGVVLDSAGDIFGTTYAGGTGSGTVYELLGANYQTLTTLVAFNGSNGGGPSSDLLLGSSGELFGTTSNGGASQSGSNTGAGTVFELSGSGDQTLTTLVNFNGTNGFQPEGGLVADNAGNLYGSTAGGGANNDGTVFELSGTDLQTLTTLVSFNGSNGSSPHGNLLFDSAGNLYGTTETGGSSNLGTVFELSGSNHETLNTLVNFDGTDGSSPDAGFVADSSGAMYGTTRLGGTNSDGTVFEIAGANHQTFSTLVNFDGFEDGAAPDAGLLIDRAGNLFGTTFGGGAGTDGTVFELPVTNYSDLNTLAYLAANNAGPQSDLAADAEGNLYFTASSGGVDTEGSVIQLTGSGFVTTAQTGIVETAAPDQTAERGDAGTFSLGSFSGTGTTGPYTIDVNWGDSTVDTTFTQASPGTITAQSHIFDAAGADTVTVTIKDSAGDTSNSPTFTVTVSAPAMPVATSVGFSQSPAAGTAGVVLIPAVSVDVEDASGALVTTDSSMVTLTLVGGTAWATLSGTTTVAAINGVATFSNLAISAAGTGYELVATDGALAGNASAPFNVIALSTLVPTLGKVVLPPTGIAGTKTLARVPVTVTNQGIRTRGTVTVDEFADAPDGTQTLLATTSRKLPVFKAGGKLPITFTIRSLPATLTAGSYHLLTEVIDPGGLTNDVITTQTMSVVLPVITPAVSVAVVTPAIVAVNRTGSVFVTIFNNGNVPAKGVLVMLGLSSEGISPVSGIVLETVNQKGVTLQPGRSVRYRLHFKLTTALTAGSYFPFVTATIGGVSTTQVGATEFTIG